MHLSVNDFAHAIRNFRSKETSGDPERRSDQNPSYRQCLVTALLANEFLWLDVHVEKVTLESQFTGYHYFNKDKQDNHIRFCEEQFEYEKVLAREHERPLSKELIDIFLEIHPEIRRKYEIIKGRFQTEIEKIFR